MHTTRINSAINNNIQSDIQFLKNASEKAKNKCLNSTETSNLIHAVKDRFPIKKIAPQNPLEWIGFHLNVIPANIQLENLITQAQQLLKKREQIIYKANQTVQFSIPIEESQPGAIKFLKNIDENEHKPINIQVKSKTSSKNYRIDELKLKMKGLFNYTLSTIDKPGIQKSKVKFTKLHQLTKQIQRVLKKTTYLPQQEYNIMSSPLSYDDVINKIYKLAPYILSSRSFNPVQQAPVFYKLSRKLTHAPSTYYIFQNRQNALQPHIFRKIHQQNLGKGFFDKTLLLLNISTQSRAALQRSIKNQRIFSNLSSTTLECWKAIHDHQPENLLAPYIYTSLSSESVTFTDGVYINNLSSFFKHRDDKNYLAIVEMYGKDLGLYLTIALQMIEGLEQLHNLGYAHRDVHLGNFLFKWDMNSESGVRVVLMDMDFAEQLNKKQLTKVSETGNLYYNPPCLKKNKSLYLDLKEHKAVDVYGLLLSINKFLSNSTSNCNEKTELVKKLNSHLHLPERQSQDQLSKLPSTKELKELILESLDRIQKDQET